MAQMIRYKGALYQRVDSETPKNISYKGQIYERVDGWFNRKVKNENSAKSEKEIKKLAESKAKEIQKTLKKSLYVKEATCEIQSISNTSLGANVTLTGIITTNGEISSMSALQSILSKDIKGLKLDSKGHFTANVLLVGF